MAKKANIAFENETHAINVQPAAPDNGAEGFSFSVQFGMTQPDDTSKRPSRRFRVFVNAVDVTGARPVASAKAAVDVALTASQGADADASLYDTESAIEAIKALIGGNEEKPKEKAWDELPDAEELRETQSHAAEAAGRYFSGEENMRAGLYDLSCDVAKVAERLSNAQFRAWVESANANLQKALTGQNAKAEFIFVGKLPREYFDLLPETSNSPKSYQRHFSVTKNELADAIATDAWGKKQKTPTPAQVWKSLVAVLDEARGDMESAPIVASEALARAMYSHIEAQTDGFKVVGFADCKAIGESGMEPSLYEGASRKFNVAIQFGTGNRAHELIAAVCKAIAANAPAAKEEKEAEKADRETAARLKPRTFAEYSVKEAALHLARVLSAHTEWAGVLDMLNDMGDRAEKDGWSQVLSDVQSGVDAEKAEAEKEAAEEAADDAA
jgi:hypothetical protein